MSADAFCVCYGLRWEIDGSNEEEVTRLEMRQDPRQLAAKKHNLDSWWANAADGDSYFLFVGKMVGNFGWESKHLMRIEDAELARIVNETKQKLRDAGLAGSPAWQFQFVPDN